MEFYILSQRDRQLLGCRETGGDTVLLGKAILRQPEPWEVSEKLTEYPAVTKLGSGGRRQLSGLA